MRKFSMLTFSYNFFEVCFTHFEFQSEVSLYGANLFFLNKLIINNL